MLETLPDGRRLVLASTSPFRRELLARLGLPFTVQAPDVDESPKTGEDASTLVARLAVQKAQAVADQESAALIIGSDQAAVLNGELIGKPGDHQRAAMQLRQASGQAVTFYTGLCLLDSASNQCQVAVESFRVMFRRLTETMIENYLRRERPYHCAGSFKSEGLGIALFERLEGDDPTGLIGLPLIRLTRMLETAGVAVL